MKNIVKDVLELTLDQFEDDLKKTDISSALEWVKTFNNLFEVYKDTIISEDSIKEMLGIYEKILILQKEVLLLNKKCLVEKTVPTTDYFLKLSLISKIFHNVDSYFMKKLYLYEKRNKSGSFMIGQMN